MSILSPPSLLPWGMGNYINSNNEKVESVNKNELKRFKATLPDIDNETERLQDLQFFALCPNGKRIPVESICEEYNRDPAGLALRTFDDRLVLVIQAIFPMQTTPYWNQAFYLSTGESSGMGGTWLPFNGILMQGDRSRIVTKFYPQFEYRERRENEKNLIFSGWFSKQELCAPMDRTIPPTLYTTEDHKKQRLEEVYGRFYLPEGDYLWYKSGFDRFGTVSFALASHALGSKLYNHREGSSIFRIYGHLSEKTNLNTPTEKMVRILNKPSPPQKCFEEMASTYPIAKPYEVNAYIDKHHAIFIMNAFREYNVFPPGLGFLNTPFQNLGYSMPLMGDWGGLADYVHKVWIEFKLGNLTIDDVKKKFANPKEAILKYKKKSRENCILPNEPGYRFIIHPKLREEKHKNNLKYYGGRRRQTKRRRQNRTKKYTRRQ